MENIWWIIIGAVLALIVLTIVLFVFNDAVRDFISAKNQNDPSVSCKGELKDVCDSDEKTSYTKEFASQGKVCCVKVAS